MQTETEAWRTCLQSASCIIFGNLPCLHATQASSAFPQGVCLVFCAFTSVTPIASDKAV